MLLISLPQRLQILNPTCKDDCIKILKMYQDKLTPDQYRNIEKVIGHLAIEGMYLSQEAIERLVRLSKKEITLEQAKAEILNDLNVPKFHCFKGYQA